MHGMLEKKEKFGAKPIRITLQSGPGQLICPHWHSYLEYIEILEGARTITVGANVLSGFPGRHCVHSFRSFSRRPHGKRLHAAALVFPARNGTARAGTCRFSWRTTTPVIGKNAELSQLLTLVYKEYSVEHAYQSAAIRALLSLLNIYICRIFALTGELKHNAAVKKAAEFIFKKLFV